MRVMATGRGDTHDVFEMRRCISGMKPTGPLHLGNLEGALRQWVGLQDRYQLFCFIADWHAYTATPVSPEAMRENIREMAVDFLAAGLDPTRATIFVQSDVKEHAELALLLGTVTPVSWLERVPAFKHAAAGGEAGSP